MTTATDLQAKLSEIYALQEELSAMVDRYEHSWMTEDERFELGIAIRDLAFHLKHLRKSA